MNMEMDNFIYGGSNFDPWNGCSWLSEASKIYFLNLYLFDVRNQIDSLVLIEAHWMLINFFFLLHQLEWESIPQIQILFLQYSINIEWLEKELNKNGKDIDVEV